MSILRLTTGVLNKNADTQYAHVEALNLSDDAQTVHVKVINWNHPNQPSELCVQPSCTITLPPNSFRAFHACLACVPFHYEIRITLTESENVIVNCFGVGDPCNQNKNMEGNTVLFKDLVVLEYDDDDYE